MSIPKSLHTVTAVRNVAHLLRRAKLTTTDNIGGIVKQAFDVLGYPDNEDPYDLIGKSILAVKRDLKEGAPSCHTN